MATPSLSLVSALRNTAQKLQNGAAYQWGHSGSCNCGHLAQEITKLSKAQIHQYAMNTGRGDWNDQVNEYCSTSNYPIDLVISELLKSGLLLEDLQRLEYLSDPHILRQIGTGIHLRHNQREHVVLYLRTWASMLENQMLDAITLPPIEDLVSAC